MRLHTLILIVGVAAAAVLVWDDGPSARAAAVPTAQGDAIVTVTGESARSSDDAKEDALRRAVEMGAGKEVFSDTRVADYTLRHDTIISRAAGYVRGYDILEKKEVQGVYTVKIQATVRVGQIRDDWGAIQVIIQRKGRPNLLIVAAEESVNLPQWTGNAAEFRLRELFLEKGFDIVDDETITRIVGREVTHAMLAQDQARAVAAAQQAHAGYVITVRALVRANPPEMVFGKPQIPATANLLAKAVATDNAQQIASKQASTKRLSDDATKAASDALNRAADEIFPELLRQILTRWSRDIEGPGGGDKMDLIGVRIQTEVVTRIVERLQQTEGVKSARIVDHNPQLTTIQITTSQDSTQIGKIVTQASGNAVEITGISPGRLDFKMRESVPSQPPPVPTPPLPAVPAPMPVPAAPAVPPVGQPPAVGRIDSERTESQVASQVVPPSPTQPGAAVSSLTPAVAATRSPGQEKASEASATPAWLIPVAISGGGVVVAFVAGLVVARRRRPRPLAGS